MACLRPSCEILQELQQVTFCAKWQKLFQEFPLQMNSCELQGLKQTQGMPPKCHSANQAPIFIDNHPVTF